jgi:hypothetical protein
MEDDAPSSSSASRDPDDWLLNGLPPQPPSLMSQKYSTFYSSDHCYAAWLPNGICVVGLAASHPLLTSLRAELAATKTNMYMVGTETASDDMLESRKRKREDGEEEQQQAPTTVGCGSVTIDFDVGKKTGVGSRADLKDSGKKAGQGVALQPGSLLAKIRISGGEPKLVRSPIAGRLLECNGALVKTPSLLWEAPEREGHLAIFFPSAAETQRAREKLMTKEAYEAFTAKEMTGGGPDDVVPVVQPLEPLPASLLSST